MNSYDIAQRIFIFIPVLLSLSVHEWAHAFAAKCLGDDTAERLGRLTLNPLYHMDPVGTLLLPLLGVPFGWAKPVPFVATRFRSNISMSYGAMIVAVAGPVSNLVLTLLSLTIVFLSVNVFGITENESPELHMFASLMVRINLALAAFNMMPIPPLDGSHIADAIMPKFLRPIWEPILGLGPTGLLLLILLPQLLGVNLFGWVQEVSGALLQYVGQR